MKYGITTSKIPYTYAQYIAYEMYHCSRHLSPKQVWKDLTILAGEHPDGWFYVEDIELNVRVIPSS